MIGLDRLRKFSADGLVGINARNCNYVYPLNERRLLPIVDSKILTKTAAASVDVPTPEMLGVIETTSDARRIEEIIGDREDFVVKPARGAQGNGILVINGRTPEGGWRKASGKPMSTAKLLYFIRNVVSGMYSKNAIADRALIEERVIFADVFDHVSASGVPDIRIIVYKGVPFMAMVRLPTTQSDGKANLHKGGVGIGVDIETGVTTTAVHKNRTVTRHPDTFEELAGIQIPGWDDMLQMAARCYDAVPLGYLGVDIVIDARKGPLLLELNARPGLSVQMANQQGIINALNKIDPSLFDA
ncbi:alpha-L-glutamate ligase-like protein [Qipengyuania sp. GH1]|uniref:alpha-L-glutamate ligase-like protein n=1 Tax=Qipengyuania aestuarii TaxID=2867241 RepID=UPI001C8691E7|nr:alpha-L-glutamate ligase-like protein [Qipengyuania aestuarii]MBX7535120.1 alpha-L-glutamate ligase-like protein [Qipengyuania aestuarii]